jgi:hypothetical protein
MVEIDAWMPARRAPTERRYLGRMDAVEGESPESKL